MASDEHRGAARQVTPERESEPQSKLKDRIGRILRDMEAQLDFRSRKASLADYIRLIQLQRELEEEEQPREIIVTWRDPVESDSALQ